MTGGDPSTGADPELAELLAATIARLDAAGARDEALGAMKQQRGIGPFKSQPTMAPIGRAWRLGILLLTRDGDLFRVGHITRALEPTRSQYLTAGVEQRKDDRRAASRGKFTTGEVVNFDYEAIAQDPAALRSGSGPLSRVGEGLVVQWGPSPGDIRDLPGYLADRATLLEEE